MEGIEYLIWYVGRWKRLAIVYFHLLKCNDFNKLGQDLIQIRKILKPIMYFKKIKKGLYSPFFIYVLGLIFTQDIFEDSYSWNDVLNAE